MAAVSTHTNGAAGYSSHRFNEGESSPWDFSAPVEQENGASLSQQPPNNKDLYQRKHDYIPQSPTKTPDKYGQATSNGGRQARSRPEDDVDQTYLSPFRIGTRPPFSESRSNSEADSLIDLYGHPRSLGERSAPNSIDRDRAIPQEELYLDEEDPDRSRWIHRDKLAVIESHEMQEAGINLPPRQKRSASKSKPRREHHQSEDASEVPLPTQRPMEDLDIPPAIESKKQRTRSPIRNEEAIDDSPLNDFDIRTPEEIAAEGYLDPNTPNISRQPDLRKSSSRIPIPKSSPMPIPQEHIERDHPLPRKRGASGNWTGDENDISFNRLRSRQNSLASQNLLDDPDALYNTPTQASRPVSRGSPTKVRNPSNTPQTIIHSRKPSFTNTPNNSQHPYKPRTTSTSTSPRTPSNPRPKSRSGLEPRPTTAVNRPEGEAPWLATMYKPDPRLPPDQQILPTHAKRLQQDQWEQSRKDSEQRNQHLNGIPSLQQQQQPQEFSPLAEHTVHGLQPSSRDRDEQALQGQGGGGAGTEWPLAPPPTSPSSKQNRDRSPALPSPNAGYSPMPKVKSGGENSPVRQGLQQQQGLRSPKPIDPFARERLEREGMGKDVEKGGAGVPAVGGTLGGNEEKEAKDKEKQPGCCGGCAIM